MYRKIESQYYVTVIIPCFNSEKYIAEAIESVLNQTHKNFELIIINDGSTDGSKDIILKYQKEDPRIVYVDQQNLGVSAARNAGIERSSGKIISFLDSDDAWEPENLEVKVSALIANENVHWVFSDVYLTDENLNKTEFMEGGNDDDILNSLLSRKGDIIHAPSNIVLKCECLKSSGIRFDTNLSTSADWDFCIQLAAHHFQGKRIPIPLWSYRILETSMSKNIKLTENDNRYVYKKAAAAKLFRSFWFRQKCFSNNFLILAGCWWVDGKDILKGSFFIAKSILYYPPNIIKVAYKARNNNIYQAKSMPFDASQNFLKRTLPFKSSKSHENRNITTFLFHRINTIDDPLWNPIHPAHFEDIILYLKKHFEPIQLSEYLLNPHPIKSSKPFCAIGFDDGYRDYIEYALPILIKHGCPSAIYVVTDCIDENLPPWTYILNHLFIYTTKLSLSIDGNNFPGHLKNTSWKNKNERINYARQLNPFLKSLPDETRRRIFLQIVRQFNDIALPHGLMLSWDELRELQQHRCEIGSHTVSHPVLSKRLSPPEILRELTDSALSIERNTGFFPTTISYPFGAYNEEVKKAALEAGYRMGVTVNPTTFRSSRHDLFEVPRIELFNEPFIKTKLRMNQIIPKIKRIVSPEG